MTGDPDSPFGTPVVQAMAEAYDADREYRAARDRLTLAEGIAREVIRLRMSFNLSQAALAKLVGTPPSVISRLERGDHEPSTATLRKIAHATGTRPVFSFAGPLRRGPRGAPRVTAAGPREAGGIVRSRSSARHPAAVG